jgi:hypothetical protein
MVHFIKERRRQGYSLSTHSLPEWFPNPSGCIRSFPVANLIMFSRYVSHYLKILFFIFTPHFESKNFKACSLNLFTHFILISICQFWGRSNMSRDARFFLHYLTPEDGIDRLSQKPVANYQPTPRNIPEKRRPRL